MIALGEGLRQRFGAHALAILFYGSCRRAHDDAGGIVDLYVLVDDYRGAYASVLPALANRMLAPNVYYLETPFAGRTARAKYAVVSLDHFERGTARWFHSYLWGRFAQPCGLLFAADATVRERVVRAIGRGGRDVCDAHAAEASGQSSTAKRCGREGLLLSYAAELRAERPGARSRALRRGGERIRRADARPRVEARLATRCVRPLSQSERPQGERLPSVRSWAVRKLQGKALSVARLLKASFTFDGGLPYLVWKIERHSGVKVEITPFMRRFPRLGAIGAMWRTWRRGGFR